MGSLYFGIYQTLSKSFFVHCLICWILFLRADAHWPASSDYFTALSRPSCPVGHSDTARLFEQGTLFGVCSRSFYLIKMINSFAWRKHDNLIPNFSFLILCCWLVSTKRVTFTGVIQCTQAQFVLEEDSAPRSVCQKGKLEQRFLSENLRVWNVRRVISERFIIGGQQTFQNALI